MVEYVMMLTQSTAQVYLLFIKLMLKLSHWRNCQGNVSRTEFCKDNYPKLSKVYKLTM
jgi:hypothetical protein